jgi:ABC-type phosphate transport system substrate-binding protein
VAVKHRLAISFCLCLSATGLSAADVVVVVHPHNPVTRLTANEAADLFLKRQLTFPGTRIRAAPLDLPSGDPVREAFYQQVVGLSPARVKSFWGKMVFTGLARPPTEVPDQSSIRRRVARDPGAIGYLDRSAADESVKVVHPYLP